jgi:hypothetical protein
MSIVRYDTRMREASHLPPKASSLGQFLFFRPVFTVTGLILMKWNFRSYICYIHKVYNNATSIYTFFTPSCPTIQQNTPPYPHIPQELHLE